MLQQGDRTLRRFIFYIFHIKNLIYKSAMIRNPGPVLSPPVTVAVFTAHLSQGRTVSRLRLLRIRYVSYPGLFLQSALRTAQRLRAKYTFTVGVGPLLIPKSRISSPPPPSLTPQTEPAPAAPVSSVKKIHYYSALRSSQTIFFVGGYV